MRKLLSDSKADQLIFFSLIAWVLSVAVPPAGLLMQFAIVIYIVMKCDVKLLPALMLVVLGRGNLQMFFGTKVILRFGITFTSTSMLNIAVFFFAVYRLLMARYDYKTTIWGWLWLLAGIPAAYISFTAKANGVVGFWSNAIMEWVSVGLYFWAISMGRTYEQGKQYLMSRLVVVVAMISVLSAIRIVYVWSYTTVPLMMLLFVCCYTEKQSASIKFCALMGCLAAIFCLVFSRAIALKGEQGYVNEVDKYGSTFATMGVITVAILMSFAIRFKIVLRQSFRLATIGAVVAIALFATWAISMRGNDRVDFENLDNAKTLAERWNSKLFGDRAGVWALGWEEVITPPYVFKDMRDFQTYSPERGIGMKLLPHNQFLTNLGRNGWWLGLYISLWIIMIWQRAMGALASGYADKLMATVYLPTGFAIFAVIGLCGQSVTTGDMWANALVCIILPGVLYGSRIRRG